MDMKITPQTIQFMLIQREYRLLAWKFCTCQRPNINWSKVVDGTTSTRWKGLQVSETVHSYNPANGWLKLQFDTFLQQIKVKRKTTFLYGT
jgi:uncharacterized membrane protein affecting hemolysin expression